MPLIDDSIIIVKIDMDQTRQAGMIDVVSFSTLTKAYPWLGHFAKRACTR